MQFDHLGIVVRTMAEGRRHLSNLLGISDWTTEFADPVNGVYVQFGRDASAICYELVSPLGEDSPILNALKGGRTILNHVAYRVTDLTRSTEMLRSQGCLPIGHPKPAIAYKNRPILFLVSPLRFIIELIEAPDHQHTYMSTPT